MRLKICFSLAMVVLLASGAGLSVAPGLHPAGGLLFQDPHTVPGLTVLDDVQGAPTTSLASAVDLSSEMPPVGDQNPQGSCVAWAIGYYDKTHAERVDNGWDVSTTDHQISPAFIYNQINAGRDGGAYISDAQRLICDQGSCMLNEFPYNDQDCTTWPTEAQYEHGIPYRGSSYSAVRVTTDNGINTIKSRLAGGQTCVLGINVYQNFDYIEDYNYTYTVHDKTGLNRGGHAVCIVGYDDDKVTTDGNGAFKLVNSWGTGWGQAGYWWMSYYAVKNTRAGLSQGYVYVTNDRDDYVPSALARVYLAHSSRDRIGITFGIGAAKSPLWTKAFRQFQILGGTIVKQPFPLNNLVFDLSDGKGYFAQSNLVYVRCVDSKRDGLTGSIDYLSAEYGTRKGVSQQTPVDIPDSRTAAYAALELGSVYGPQGEPLAGSFVADRAWFRNGAATVAFELAKPGAVRIAVYDGTGRTVAATNAQGQSGQNELSVKVPQSHGVYFYRLESGSFLTTGKFAAIR